MIDSLKKGNPSMIIKLWTLAVDTDKDGTNCDIFTSEASAYHNLKDEE